MFERFTSQSRRSVVLAQEEARRLNHNYIGTEHLLLGLLYEGQGVAAKALGSADVTLEAARAQAEILLGRGQEEPSGHVPFTPRAKKCLESSWREASRLGHGSIGTGHLLLALIRIDDCAATQMLGRLGADLGDLRARVMLEIEGHPEQQAAPAPSPPRVQVRPRSIESLMDTIDERLGAIERHVGIARATEVNPEARADPGGRGEAIRLRTEAARLKTEAARLRAEVVRLRALLREHDIDPG